MNRLLRAKLIVGTAIGLEVLVVAWCGGSLLADLHNHSTNAYVDIFFVLTNGLFLGLNLANFFKLRQMRDI